MSLARLHPAEFDDLLRDTLKNIPLRDLRGFKQLKDHLRRRPGSFVIGQRQNPLEYVDITDDAELTRGGQSQPGERFSWKTQVQGVSRGCLSQFITYGRNESDEVTVHQEVAERWGHEAYVKRVDKRELVLRRPADHTWADESLFLLLHHYEKVPHEDRMVTTLVEVVWIPIDGFREFFGPRYSRVAQYLFWELESIVRRTLDELERAVARLKTDAKRLEQISEAVME
ncbi:MAG: hypothetical protein A2758_00095 [Candidatus Zambryskibacteria bacterium RIFCSPHIGHO2_01_FULL_49_18]|uniref:Uncharacterized protein n=1 Tax=Candidatus Zambryskibacteria bacterium RIFCSPHIGHO2_01_FULL_49_18 TaxID=1802740 RepID=A0A1G2T3B5_9BACT|nr:MAG: hypothetical protein A2758_00095 [Candidatus Zambryskibacteria bacterium RIFCSPHIGHO2_01_FULL_49_18]